MASSKPARGDVPRAEPRPVPRLRAEKFVVITASDDEDKIKAVLRQNRLLYEEVTVFSIDDV